MKNRNVGSKAVVESAGSDKATAADGAASRRAPTPAPAYTTCEPADVEQETRARLLSAEVLAKYNQARGSWDQFAAGVKRKVRCELVRRELKSGRIPATRLFPLTPPATPLEEAIRRERCEWVRWAIGRLSRADGEVVGRYLTGLALGGKSPFSNAERIRLSRALRKLAPLLASCM
jgi:hypothetical protein